MDGLRPLEQFELNKYNEFVIAAGHDPRVVSKSDDPAMQRLHKSARMYAIGQLATAESRANFMRHLNGQA